MTTEPESTDREAEAQSFLEATENAKGGLLSDFFEFMGENAKWWLLPFVIVFLLIGGLLIFAGGAVSTFIYALF